LPALQSGKINQGPSEYAPGEEFDEEENKNGEPIDSSKMQVARPLIQVFGEPPVRKVFSRTWALREDGIGEIEDMILQGGNSGDSLMFLNGIGVANETLGDKISGVCLRAIKFLGNLC
jgi:hypothetical protein